MTIAINGSTINLDLETVLIWVLVGLVAGFFASHLALGHGLGVFWDVIVGILGGLFGGIVLAGIFHISVGIVGHPILSAMIMAFLGAAILLIILRLFAGRGSRRRAF
jgi:uncharacterized membrane protein YeaQ/YmgE (transglycosylase-associated protein family)